MLTYVVCVCVCIWCVCVRMVCVCVWCVYICMRVYVRAYDVCAHAYGVCVCVCARAHFSGGGRGGIQCLFEEEEIQITELLQQSLKKVSHGGN